MNEIPPRLHVSQLVPMGVNRNKTGGRTKKCFKEVTSSLKGWRKKFFLIDRRAIPDAMPWRHIDTDLCDDFSTHYNEDDANRLAGFVVPLRPPPRHLLYVCGLTTACRHPELSYFIKDQNGKVITVDAFLKLPVWSRIVMSKRDPIPNSQRPPLHTTPPLEAGGLVAPPRKRVRKNQEHVGSGSKRTLSPMPLHHVAPPNADKTATAIPNVAIRNAINVEKEAVDLSGNTRVTTPPVTVNQPSPHSEPNDTQENVVFSDAHSFHSTHHEDTKEDATDHHGVGSFKDGPPKADADKRWFVKEVRLLDSAHSTCSERERELTDRLKDMEKERDDWSLCLTVSWLGGLSLGKSEEQNATVLSETRDLDIEGSKTWEAKHRELFIMQYPYIQKVVGSYRLLVDALMKVSPDVLPSNTADGAEPSTADGTGDAARRSPSWI
ncbi:hypothetical protein Tco_1022894 [Tanacetum coccineum]